MRAGTRVEHIYAKLTAEERVATILTELNAGQTPDRAILISMPDAQVAAYRQYVARLERLDSMGRAWVLAIAAAVEAIETRLGWLATLILVGARLEPVRQAWETGEGGHCRSDLHRAVAQGLEHLGRVLGEGEGAPSTAPDPPLVEVLRARIRADVGEHWAALRAIESVVVRLSGELGGADPLPTEVRALFDRCTQRLETLARDGLLGSPVALCEPDAQRQEEARAIVGDLTGV